MWRICNPWMMLFKCKVVQLLLNTAWKFLKNLNTELPYDQRSLLLGVYPREIKNWSPKKLYVHVHSSIIHIVKRKVVHLHIPYFWFYVSSLFIVSILLSIRDEGWVGLHSLPSILLLPSSASSILLFFKSSVRI